MQSYQWFIYLFIHVYNIASIIINRTYTLLEYIFRSDLLFPLSSSHVSRTDRKSIVERYFSEAEARLDRGIPEYVTRHCTSRGIIMPSTEGSQFPGTGSELSKNCLTSAWMTSACEYLQVSPLSLFLSLSPLASLSRTLDRPKITILNLFGNVVDARRSSCLVRMEKRKKSVREREREGARFEGYKARFEGSIQYRAFTSDPWSERRGNHLVSSKKNRYRGCGVVKSTFNEDARRWERGTIFYPFLLSSFSFLFLSLSLSPPLFSFRH